MGLSSLPELAYCALRLVETGELERAVDLYQRAASLTPAESWIYNDLGLALLRAGRVADAERAHGAAVALRPWCPETCYNAAFPMLKLGRWTEGLRAYELRQFIDHRRWPDFHVPRWSGAPLSGQRVLVWTDHGRGDAIQFARYVPEIARRGGRVILAAPCSLHRLFHKLEGVEKVIVQGDPPPSFDLEIPVTSLPQAVGATPSTIPATPYLHANPCHVRRWRWRLQSDERLRVGLVWAGNPLHADDANRSMPARTLAPLLDVPATRFFSLQVGEGQAELGGLAGVEDLGPGLTDFAATAAVIANLDIVITVDTAVAHLAGAMGRRVWAMLPFCADWRWLDGRDDTPWYPTMRLFRQSRRGDWTDVVAAVRVAVAVAAGRRVSEAHAACPSERSEKAYR